jgi:MFS family permease
LLLALTQGIELGWTSTSNLALFGFSLGALAFFVYWELRSPFPALDLTLFRNRLYDFSVLAAAFQSLAIFSVQFLVVFYLQAVRGYSPFSAALHLLPLPVVNAIVGPFSGRLSDRIGARLPATVGLLIQSAALYWLSTTTIESSYLHVAVGLALMGLGGGLFWSPNTSAAMGAAPSARLGVAAATLATLRNTGMVTSFAVALAVAAGSLPQDLVQQLFIGTSVHLGTPLMLAFVDGMEAAFRFSIVVCLIAAVLSFVRGSEERRT